MELYEVTTDYVEYLRKFEPTKILTNSDNKNTRKFLGVVVKKGKYNYVVPLSSPKYKKDFEIKGYSGDKLPSDYEYSGVRVPSVRAQETVIPFLKKPPFR